MAKPTPPFLFSPFGFPTQNKVNLDLFSIRWSLSETHVLESAAMSMLKLCSSLVTRVVLRSGRPDDFIIQKGFHILTGDI